MSDNEAFRSWQRIGNRSPREYYDRRSAAGHPGGLLHEIAPNRGGLGRLLVTVGVLVGLVGFVGTMWLILAVLEALDPNSAATNPFTGPVVLAVLAALIGGGVVAAIGSSMARRGP